MNLRTLIAITFLLCSFQAYGAIDQATETSDDVLRHKQIFEAQGKNDWVKRMDCRLLCHNKGGQRIPGTDYIQGFPLYNFDGLDVFANEKPVTIGILISLKNPLQKDKTWFAKTSNDIELSITEQLLSKFGQNQNFNVLSAEETEKLLDTVDGSPPHRISLEDRNKILEKNPNLLLIEIRYVRDLYKMPIIKNVLTYRLFNLQTRLYFSEEKFISFVHGNSTKDSSISSGWYWVPLDKKGKDDTTSFVKSMSISSKGMSRPAGPPK
ncbi:MAG: hypothetical protein P9M03_12295 [Candidatus Theseobacter exili]|nr:hypothetical protein [Candidatus Theseobacter exili]